MIFGNNLEDVEAIAPLDILRRAQVTVETWGVGSDTISGRTRVPMKMEKIFRKRSDVDVEAYDGILLPGGPGVSELVGNEELIELVKEFRRLDKLIFAICAAPTILDRAGLLEGKRYTCFPDSRKDIRGGTHVDAPVVVDGKLITSQGLGTAIDAGLALVEVIVSKKEAELQRERIVYRR
jgi:4-methyl-5(b-hydroxyethyl)-thiazole monophosphate biosynthesis